MHHGTLRIEARAVETDVSAIELGMRGFGRVDARPRTRHGLLGELYRFVRQRELFLACGHRDEAARDLGEHIELTCLTIDLQQIPRGTDATDTRIALAAKLDHLRQPQRDLGAGGAMSLAAAEHVLDTEIELGRGPQPGLCDTRILRAELERERL
ncbi:MAG TPA: hypothetical protein VFM56_01815 [Solimonas sp.]|nr:hypothetical protein [Solimonas sp.]